MRVRFLSAAQNALDLCRTHVAAWCDQRSWGSEAEWRGTCLSSRRKRDRYPSESRRSSPSSSSGQSATPITWRCQVQDLGRIRHAYTDGVYCTATVLGWVTKTPTGSGSTCGYGSHAVGQSSSPASVVSVADRLNHCSLTISTQRGRCIMRSGRGARPAVTPRRRNVRFYVGLVISEKRLHRCL